MKFSASRADEMKYRRALRQVAREVGAIIDAYHLGDGVLKPGLSDVLQRYSDLLAEWAPSVAERFIKDAANRNERAWKRNAKIIGRGLTDLLTSKDGVTISRLIREQVDLITSLPTEAGERAQDIAMQAAIGGRRADEAAQMINASGEVTSSRAQLIARTEIARANATISAVRAQNIGVTHYIWQTAKDEIVRHSHAMMQGRICEYGNPPEVQGEGRHGPGEIYNCRCWGEPILPEN